MSTMLTPEDFKPEAGELFDCWIEALAISELAYQSMLTRDEEEEAYTLMLIEESCWDDLKEYQISFEMDE